MDIQWVFSVENRLKELEERVERLEAGFEEEEEIEEEQPKKVKPKEIKE